MMSVSDDAAAVVAVVVIVLNGDVGNLDSRKKRHLRDEASHRNMSSIEEARR